MGLSYFEIALKGRHLFNCFLVLRGNDVEQLRELVAVDFRVKFEFCEPAQLYDHGLVADDILRV